MAGAPVVYKHEASERAARIRVAGGMRGTPESEGRAIQSFNDTDRFAERPVYCTCQPRLAKPCEHSMPWRHSHESRHGDPVDAVIRGA